MYKISELRVKTREELLKLISELKGKLLALRFEAATGQLKETHLPSSTKKDIALIFTVLKEKELGIVFEEKTDKKLPDLKKELSETKETNENHKEDNPTLNNEKLLEENTEEITKESKTSVTIEEKQESSKGDSK